MLQSDNTEMIDSKISRCGTYIANDEVLARSLTHCSAFRTAHGSALSGALTCHIDDGKAPCVQGGR